MFDRRLVKHFDWGLLILTVMLCGAGLTTLYASVHARGLLFLHTKQSVWFGVGFIVMTVCFIIDYKEMERYALGIYAAMVLMLIAVLVFGKVAGGSRRWLILGPVSLQPSEFVKIGLIIFLARYFARHVRPQGLGIRELILPILYTAIPFALIVRQPDLGTAMMLVLIMASMSLFMRIEIKTMVFAGLTVSAFVPAVWSMLKEYQRQRIMTFLNPDRDPLGTGYHIIQSKIAIGSGMGTGKGFLKGTQNTLSFLPEQHTDFIFSVLAEEWGFVGGIGIGILLMILCVYGIAISYQAKNTYAKILSIGITSLFFWQTVINLGMVMGVFPVVGMPLPLISYGGSSVVTVMMGIGILMNISMRRFTTD